MTHLEGEISQHQQNKSRGTYTGFKSQVQETALVQGTHKEEKAQRERHKGNSQGKAVQ